MKLAVSLLALAAAVAPPRIELKLVQQDGVSQPIIDNDWTERCPASAETNEQNCPFPEAKAFDHNGDRLPVKESVWKLDVTGAKTTPEALWTTNHRNVKANRNYVNAFNFAQKGIFLFEYTAKDLANNEADKIVFQLILDDLQPPTITCSNFSPKFTTDIDCTNADACIEVFSTSYSDLFPSCTFADNNTPSQDITVQYKLFGCEDDARDRNQDGKYCAVKTQIGTVFTSTTAVLNSIKSARLQAYSIGIIAKDNAGIYGASGQDNFAVKDFTVRIVDTVAPTVNLVGANHLTLECGESYLRRKVQPNGDFFYTDFDGNQVSEADRVKITRDFAAAGNNIDNTNPQRFSGGVDVTDNYDCTDAVRTQSSDLAFFNAHCPMRAHATTDLNEHSVGDYTITYSATDSSNNVGTQTRVVSVIDDQAPVVELVGADTMTYHVKGAVAFKDPGVNATDNCDDLGHTQNLAGSTDMEADMGTNSNGQLQLFTYYTDAQTTSVELGSNCEPTTTTLSYSSLTIGTYIKHYVVKDLSSNCGTASRTLVFVDKEQPIINLEGAQILTVEADRDDPHWDDEGATCTDYVHGNLNRAVRSTGDIVKKDAPGNYFITYTCKDPSGNHAVPVVRTVVVADTTCPIVTLNGDTEMTIEAGFPYEDAQATVTDTFDGTVSIVESGNTVNYAHVFYTLASCADIKNAYADAQSGTYTISRTNTGTNVLEQVIVECDMVLGRTYFLCQGCAEITPTTASVYQYPNMGTNHNEGDCSNYGLKLARWAYDPTVASEQDHDGDSSTPNKKGREWAFAIERFPSAFEQGAVGTYLCSSNDASAPETNVAKTVTTTNANQGKYIIQYNAVDNAGNGPECPSGSGCGCPAKRTVHVVDSLPPVITLRLRNKLVAVSGPSSSTGVGGQENLAYKPISVNNKGNPFLWQEALMAESTTSVNGWAIAAIASAVVGVALLSFSKSATTSVPV